MKGKTRKKLNSKADKYEEEYPQKKYEEIARALLDKAQEESPRDEF